MTKTSSTSKDRIESKDIFKKLKRGEAILHDDPEYYKINKLVTKTLSLINQLNQSGDIQITRDLLSKITGRKIDESVTVYPPFYTNFGRFIYFGKNVFINHACSFLDFGGIILEDNVLIGPQVKLVTENHSFENGKLKALICKPINIKRNAWIGAGVTILPGVTVGENAVVAAGSVVTKDVNPNTIIAGNPAKVIQTMNILPSNG